MIIQWNSGVQQLAQGYGLSIWNWGVIGGAAPVPVGQICGEVIIRPSFSGAVRIGDSNSGMVSIVPSYRGAVKIARCE